MGEASPSTKRRVLGVALTLVLLGGLGYATNRWPSLAPMPAPAAMPEPEAATADVPPAVVSGAPAPTFDLVRIEPDGAAAVVGTASPGATVTIYADEAPLAEVEADAQGNFVALFQVEPSAQPRSLTLGTVTPDGGAARSDDVVMLLPQAPDAPEPDAVPDPGAPPVVAAAEPAAPGNEAEPVEAVVDPVAAVQPKPETTVPEPAAVAEVEGVIPEAVPIAVPPAVKTPAVETTPAEPEVAATALIRADAVEVMPPEGDPAAERRVTLASISYASAGTVTLAGVGTAGSKLRVYVDDRFASEAVVADDGRWRLDLGDVARGVYRLRIDQLAGDGKVASRVETPFQRDLPQPPPPRPQRTGPGELGPGTVSVTVQPGHNLWTLARARYGSGVMYTQILTANRELIRDPDLIYPGQIFNLPAPAAAE